MKKLFFLLLTPLAVCAADLRTNLTLVCNYDPVALWGTTINFYGSSNITVPTSNWVQVASVYQGTQTVVQVFPGSYWYVARATNLIGVSDFSNVARQPVPPSSDFLLQLK
jgi:hypothetical protein